MKAVITNGIVALLLSVSFSAQAGERHQEDHSQLENRAQISNQRIIEKRIERLERHAVTVTSTCSAKPGSTECQDAQRKLRFLCVRQPGPEVCNTPEARGEGTIAVR